MNPDQVIELRRLWSRYEYGLDLPEATVLATGDWVAYVQAMAQAVPEGEEISLPSEEEARWAWPDGVAVVFSEPFEIDHTIISRTRSVDGSFERTEPHVEKQLTAGVVIAHSMPVEPRDTDGNFSGQQVVAHPVLWLGADPKDVISAYWMPDGIMHAAGTLAISESSRVLLSIITALGHRLTRVDEPAGSRGERRRAKRELPGLRVLTLASGASVSKSNGGSVEWTKRWMVRGHWRLQPHGPKHSLRRAQWIDPFVKGPEDKPLDVRPTIWRAELDEGAAR